MRLPRQARDKHTEITHKGVAFPHSLGKLRMIDGKELYDLSSDPGAASVFWVHLPVMKSSHHSNHAETDSHDRPNRTNLNQKDVVFSQASARISLRAPLRS
jgi:hypothetical protein